ncbi:MAG: xanthine dehydrogenase family protein molybdopterin-binding subunit [Chloroflexota bacterium]|nr:xanthine dehydrogenase family protein molybdopterin-binding subunit [Dehalococcoidia bacterium]MDW8254422.1 xanthine dehydrogenase family protein molybdopterin-binding subunit [Chloroflexota bacterium]
MELKTVGQPVGQVAGPLKVTGRALYTADIRLPNTAWGAVVRSTLPHARIVSIDTSAARAMPGVLAVITGKDIPPGRVGRRLRDLPILAVDTVRFVGERVAAVAAEDRATAEAAAQAIVVEYEELPAVLTPRDALAPGAPVLHPDLASYDGFPGPPPAQPNVLSRRVYAYGDIDEGFRRADVIIQRRYTVPRQHQGYLEPHACLVSTAPDGTAEVWLTNKTPFQAQEQLAKALGIPKEWLKIHVTTLGGDFGGKGSVMDAPVAYYLSKACGRPVRMVMSYVEELTAAASRHAAQITMKTGVKRDGTIVAHQVRAIFDSGAYGAFKPSPTLELMGNSRLGGAYRMENVSIEALIVYTNTFPAGHMRAPGLPQAVFALESHIDALARAIEMDPVEFRRRNLIRDGEMTPAGERWEQVRAVETLEAAARAAGWGTPLPENVGRGIAIAEHGAGAGTCTIQAGLDERGFYLRTGAPDTGTGSHTVMQQVAAEALGVPPAAVRIETSHTLAFPFDFGVGGSRVTHVYGQASLAAATALRETICRRAAAALGLPADHLQWESGSLRQPDGCLADPFALIGPVEVEETYDAAGAPHVTGFCAQVAEVRVDRETGKVEVLRIVSAHDTGQVINPLGHEGQIAGGVIQGLGYALMEELPVVDGYVTTQSLAEYKMPAMGDIPNLEIVLLPAPLGPGPFAAKAIGETPNVPTAAAIANAVEDAVGVRIVDLPLTAEKIYRALQRQQEHGHTH